MSEQQDRPLIDWSRVKGPPVSTILRVFALVCFLLAFLILVASASLGFEPAAWGFLGLAAYVLADLVP